MGRDLRVSQSLAEERQHFLFPAREIDPLMGWTSSREMKSQVRLSFDTKEEAIAYAQRYGIPYRLAEPRTRAPVRKSYSDNFRFGRKEAWTH